jgi:hypothetical protein
MKKGKNLVPIKWELIRFLLSVHIVEKYSTIMENKVGDIA